MLEVGDAIRECRSMLQIMPFVTIKFIRNQANKAAYLLARYPYFVYCHVDFTSPPSCLLETLVLDFAK